MSTADDADFDGLAEEFAEAEVPSIKVVWSDATVFAKTRNQTWQGVCSRIYLPDQSFPALLHIFTERNTNDSASDRQAHTWFIPVFYEAKELPEIEQEIVAARKRMAKAKPLIAPVTERVPKHADSATEKEEFSDALFSSLVIYDPDAHDFRRAGFRFRAQSQSRALSVVAGYSESRSLGAAIADPLEKIYMEGYCPLDREEECKFDDDVTVEFLQAVTYCRFDKLLYSETQIEADENKESIFQAILRGLSAPLSAR